MIVSVRKFWKHTVFSSPPQWAHSNEMLATYFHRSAATLYLIYLAWALVTFGLYLPTMPTDNDITFGDLFSLIVIPVAALACIGATFFPKLGRLEMYAASALVPMICLYIGFVSLPGAINTGHWQNLILNLAHIVVPSARVVFIFRTLIWHYGERD